MSNSRYRALANSVSSEAPDVVFPGRFNRPSNDGSPSSSSSDPEPPFTRHSQASGPAGNLSDVDIDTSELHGLAQIDVNRYVGLAQNIPIDGWLPLIEAGSEDECASGSPLVESMQSETIPRMVWRAACEQYLFDERTSYHRVHLWQY
ncbi:hypothetical protein NX059_002547 [Plenodomus lindquistii]|nr:hypothetical protein NX059_002547 [Plenodomus lindquistii]